jgi:NAD(P)-dependent dehydrogenase (short-subunit alcohol dehydrogenase family)
MAEPGSVARDGAPPRDGAPTATGRALTGRTALITGGTRGLGLEIARAYLAAGVDGLCVCGRDADALEHAVAELSELAEAGESRAGGPGAGWLRAGGHPKVMGEIADVSAPADVQRLVASALAGLGGLTILVCNAGVYGPKGPVAQTDWSQWVRAVEVNLFGSVLPARAVAPHFTERGYGKIVQLSGGGATGPLPGLSAYAASKAAAVRFAETLACELREHGVDVNAIAPGALNTRMLDEVLAAGPELVGESFHQRALRQRERGGDPLRLGAALAVFLGSAASDGITGRLLSAVWDPWPELPGRRGDLDGDLYTLRRIVPADRGLDWGAV